MEWRKHPNGVIKISAHSECPECGEDRKIRRNWVWTSGTGNMNWGSLGPVVPSFDLQQCASCDTWLLNMMMLIGGGGFNVAIDYDPDTAEDWVKDLNLTKAMNGPPL